MNASELSDAIQPVFDNWYNNLKKHLHAGSLSSSNTIYCQDVINLYETDEYLAIELTGEKKLSDFQSITFSKKVKKLATINSLINGGTVIKEQAIYNPRIDIATAGEIWVGLHVASYDAYNSSAQCLNLQKWKEGLAAAPSIPVKVQTNAGGLLLAESTIMRLEAPKLYFRKIPMILVISKQTDLIRLVHFLIARLNETFPKRDRFIGIYDDEITQKNPVQQLANNKDLSLEKFLEENAALLAHVLGYKSAKANVSITGYPTIDLLLETEEGTYDLCNLRTGLFSRQATKGKKNKPNLSSYTLAIKEQLQQCQAQQQVLKEQTGLQLATTPLMIGIVENSNQVYHQALNKAATEQEGQVALLSLDSLSTLVELSMKNKV
ncbi:MAG: hypothetical protein ACRBFS_13310 [Aureispira sp.]